MDKNNRPLAGALSEDQSEEADASLAVETTEPEPDLALAPVEAGGGDVTLAGEGIPARSVTRAPGALTVPAWANANPITRYFYECYIELRKTTWPSNGEAWTMTWIVIGMSIGVAILLGAADYGFNYVINWVLTVAGK